MTGARWNMVKNMLNALVNEASEPLGWGVCITFALVNMWLGDFTVANIWLAASFVILSLSKR